MKKKLILGLIFVVILGISVRTWRNLKSKNSSDIYEFEEITKGNFENTISCTGTINAVGTVAVGTQVSGTIATVFCDFNDNVNKGQILAVLDTLTLKAAVLDAEAGVARAQAQLEQAQANSKRVSQLFEKGYVSEAENLTVQINLKTALATLKSAEAAQERTRRSLEYAVIRSPIQGTIIQKNVEAGQTVAASFTTPTLFIITSDLSRMEIHALVDESDIGPIRVGQNVRFTVQAYPDEIFSGSVKQVRLQPSTIQNVVNYTVVITAFNEKNLLLPGMTATVDFIIEQKKDVLLVPNPALQVEPTAAMVSMILTNQVPLPDSILKKAGKTTESFKNDKYDTKFITSLSKILTKSEKCAFLWSLDEKGDLKITQVKIGSTDNIKTEITGDRNLHEGMKVITGIIPPEKRNEKNSENKKMFFGTRPG